MAWNETILKMILKAMSTKTDLKIVKYGKILYHYDMSPEKRRVLEACFKGLGIELCCDVGGFVGSSDIGNVDYVCPSFYPIVGIGRPELCLHTKDFADAMTDEMTH